jgi:hypothetical protein
MNPRARRGHRVERGAWTVDFAAASAHWTRGRSSGRRMATYSLAETARGAKSDMSALACANVLPLARLVRGEAALATRGPCFVRGELVGGALFVGGLSAPARQRTNLRRVHPCKASSAAGLRSCVDLARPVLLRPARLHVAHETLLSCFRGFAVRHEPHAASVVSDVHGRRPARRRKSGPRRSSAQRRRPEEGYPRMAGAPGRR